MKARGAHARRDALAVGRQLRVILFEYVQSLGGSLYGLVRPTELVLPLLSPEVPGVRLVPHLVYSLGEPYVALVVFQVPVVASLEELGRGAVPAAQGHIVVRVRHLDSQARGTVFRTRGHSARSARLRCPLPLTFCRRGPARIRRFSQVPIQ